MRPSQLNRTLRLIRRTGDKAFVMDLESDEVFVIMDLDNYEGLLDVLDVPRIPVSPNTQLRINSPEREVEHEAVYERSEEITVERHHEHQNVLEKVPAVAESVVEESFDDFELTAESVDEPLSEPTSEPTVTPLITPVETQESAVSNQETTENLTDVADDGEEEKFYLEPLE